jgi:hypothetical protein
LVANEQVPEPLQVPAALSTPAVQDAVLHEVVDAGYEHEVALVPSQREPQAVPAPVPPQAGRVPTGAPTTLLHVPIEPATLHAWH